VCASRWATIPPGSTSAPTAAVPLERVQEESYFFKLSAFQDRLLALYDEHPDFVQPDFRMTSPTPSWRVV